MTEILSPVCPRCGEPPAIAISEAQAICGTDVCPVFCWDMRDPPGTFDREAIVIDLPNVKRVQS